MAFIKGRKTGTSTTLYKYNILLDLRDNILRVFNEIPHFFYLTLLCCFFFRRFITSHVKENFFMLDNYLLQDIQQYYIVY